MGDMQEDLEKESVNPEHCRERQLFFAMLSKLDLDEEDSEQTYEEVKCGLVAISPVTSFLLSVLHHIDYNEHEPQLEQVNELLKRAIRAASIKMLRIKNRDEESLGSKASQAIADHELLEDAVYPLFETMDLDSVVPNLAQYLCKRFCREYGVKWVKEDAARWAEQILGPLNDVREELEVRSKIRKEMESDD